MSKTYLLIIRLIILLFVFQACKRDTHCGDQSDIIDFKYVTDENKGKIPYTGKDTLIFISDANDTATLIGQGQNTYFETVNQNLGTNDCQKKYIGKYENIELRFTGNNLLSSIQIKYYTNEYEDQIFAATATSNNLFLNTNECSLKYNNDENNYTDSILINNKYYRGINNRGVFYNAKDGILRIKFINGKEFYKAK